MRYMTIQYNITHHVLTDGRLKSKKIVSFMIWINAIANLPAVFFFFLGEGAKPEFWPANH